MNKSEKFFDKVSSKSKSEPNQTAFKIIESSKEFLKKDSYILDFGCGSGAITKKLSKTVKSIDAIDISSGMLEFAKKQSEKSSIANINYIQDSIFDECFKNKKYDVILAFNVLHYIEDMPSLIERINTLLKPDGVFIFIDRMLKRKEKSYRLPCVITYENRNDAKNILLQKKRTRSPNHER